MVTSNKRRRPAPRRKPRKGRTPSQKGRYSRNKGQRGEREAVQYLKDLGFEDTRRLSQSDGSNNAEVEILSIPHLHIEVKYGYPLTTFDICTSLFRQACDQAERDAKDDPWIVLWKPYGYRTWRASFPVTSYDGVDDTVVTVAGEDDIYDTIIYFKRVMEQVDSRSAERN